MGGGSDGNEGNAASVAPTPENPTAGDGLATNSEPAGSEPADIASRSQANKAVSGASGITVEVSVNIDSRGNAVDPDQLSALDDGAQMLDGGETTRKVLGAFLSQLNTRSHTLVSYADAIAGDESSVISNVKIYACPKEYENKGEQYYVEVTRNSEGKYELKSDDLLRFTMDYNIPPKLLDEKGEYKFQIKGLILDKEETGDIDDGGKGGTYTIATDGFVTLHFSEADVEYNKTDTLTGHIKVGLGAQKVDTQGGGVGGVTIGDTPPLSIFFPDKTVSSNDLRVKKTSVVENLDQGVICYRVEVWSENGTHGHNVELTDIIKQGGALTCGSLTVGKGTKESQDAKAQGTTQFDDIIQNGFTESKAEFVVTLPPLNAKECYVVEYRAKVPGFDSSATDTSVNNEVTALSKREDGTIIKDPASIWTPLNKELIDKRGQVVDGKVEWTIEVNKNKLDIGGYTIADEKYEGAVTIKPAILDPKTGTRTENISLPFTFNEGETDSYIITYTTEIVPSVGSNTMKNKVTLTPPNGNPGVSSVGSVVVPGLEDGAYQPVSKTGTFVGANANDSGLVDLLWHANINAGDYPLKAEWTFEDELYKPGDGAAKQYFAEDQLEQIKRNIDVALRAALEIDENVSQNKLFELTPYKDWIDGREYITKFTVKFKIELPANTPLSFDVPSTGFASDKQYYNQAGVNNGTKVSAVVDTEQGGVDVTKTDAAPNSSGEKTEHGLKETGGKLKWNINVAFHDGVRGPIRIQEALPEGLHLDSFEVNPNNALQLGIDGYNEGSKVANDGKIVVYNGWDSNTHKPIVDEEGNPIVAEYKVEGGIVVFTLNDAFINFVMKYQKKCTFTICAAIDNDYASWQDSGVPGQSMAEFKNTVRVLDGQDRELSSDDQTQVLVEDDYANAISKACVNKGGDGKGNLKYQLEINPEGKTLQGASDGTPLTITDVLTYEVDEAFAGRISLNLQNDSLKLYEAMTDDGGKLIKKINEEHPNGIELSSDEWSYAYEESSPSLGSYERTLTIKVPDGKPLIVEYTYAVNGEDNIQATNIVNTAKLEGAGQTGEDHEDAGKRSVSSSSVTVTGTSITMRKIDSEDHKLLLRNVKFAIKKWDASEKAYVPINLNDLSVSVDDGQAFGQDLGQGTVVVDLGESGVITAKAFKPNTAYRLVEISAPKGYIKSNVPYDFYIAKAGDNVPPLSCPDYFELRGGHVVQNGGTIDIPNAKKTTSVVVQKNWLDLNDELHVPAGVDQLKITLGRYKSAQRPAVDPVDLVPVVFTVKTIGSNQIDSYDSVVAKKTQTYVLMAERQKALVFSVDGCGKGIFRVATSSGNLTGESIEGKKPIWMKGPNDGGYDHDTCAKYRIDRVEPGEDGALHVEVLLGCAYSDDKFAIDNATSAYSGEQTLDIDETYKPDPIVIPSGEYSVWTHTIDELPLMGEENGQIYYYTYFIESEDAPSSYEVVTQTPVMDADDGVEDGTITLTNKHTDELILPSTGGGGVGSYLLGGLALVVATLGLTVAKRRSALRRRTGRRPAP